MLRSHWDYGTDLSPLSYPFLQWSQVKHNTEHIRFPGPGTYNLGPGSWDLGPGSWVLGPMKQGT